MNDVVNIIATGLELHSTSSILLSAFVVFLVSQPAHLLFSVMHQYFTFFRRMSGAVQHARFGPSRLVT